MLDTRDTRILVVRDLNYDGLERAGVFSVEFVPRANSQCRIMAFKDTFELDDTYELEARLPS